MTKLNKQQLIELVDKIMNADGSEEELDKFMDILENNVPNPNVSDLIFWNDKELSSSEIVELALSYQPIHLPNNNNENK